MNSEVRFVRQYNCNVRVGNWNEDICLEEEKLKSFLSKKDNGELSLHMTQKKMSQSLKPSGVSSTEDGFVHIGQTVAFVNPASNTLLAINANTVLDEEFKDSYPATSTFNNDAVARNTFKLEKWEGEEFDDNFLCYGQKFHIATSDALHPEKKLYLHSERVSFAHYANQSRFQEVSFSKDKSYNTCWKMLCRDPNYRLETDGEPIPANSQCIIVHCNTNQALFTDGKFFERNHYGMELEVSSKTCLDPNKVEVASNVFAVHLDVPRNGGGETKEAEATKEEASPAEEKKEEGEGEAETAEEVPCEDDSQQASAGDA
eukprot:Nk52_evm14s914 gene=Nk52_evmTU14s914